MEGEGLANGFVQLNLQANNEERERSLNMVYNRKRAGKSGEEPSAKDKVVTVEIVITYKIGQVILEKRKRRQVMRW